MNLDDDRSMAGQISARALPAEDQMQFQTGPWEYCDWNSGVFSSDYFGFPLSVSFC